MSRVDEWLERIDRELAENNADREAHLADPSVGVLVDLGYLPEDARDYFARKDAA